MASDIETARTLMGPKRFGETDQEYDSRVRLIAAALRKERSIGERTGIIRAMALLRNDLDKPRDGLTSKAG